METIVKGSNRSEQFNSTQNEIKLLKNHYQRLVLSRKAYVKETKSLLSVQKATLNRLKMERKALQFDADLSQSGYNRKRDAKYNGKLALISKQHSELLKEIDEVSNQSSDLDNAILKVHKKINDKLKYKPVDGQGHNKNVREREKLVSKLENQLFVANTKYNLLDKENVRLLSEIKFCLKRAARLNELHDDLEKKLNKIRMAERLEEHQRKISFESSIDVREKIMAFISNKERQFKDHLNKLKNAQRDMILDSEAKKFVYNKNQNRLHQDHEEFNQIILHQQAMELTLEHHISVYETVLGFLAEMTERGNLSELARYFAIMDGANLSLRHSVKQVFDDVEILRDALAIPERGLEAISEDSRSENLISKMDEYMAYDLCQNGSNNTKAMADGGGLDSSMSKHNTATEADINERTILRYLRTPELFLGKLKMMHEPRDSLPSRQHEASALLGTDALQTLSISSSSSETQSGGDSQ